MTIGLVVFVFTLFIQACPIETITSNTAVGSSPAFAASSRLTVFISDLHFGVGRDASRNWHATEDFRWETEFRLFLQEINRQGSGTVDLILNGDTFEMWQSIKDDCGYDNRNFGCTEADAVNRTNQILSAHAGELDALREFANAGDNRIIIIPGNHDAALLFPAVSDAVLKKLNAKRGRVRIISEGYWLSSDQLIYAEHGHQIGEEVNRFANWPKPFLEAAGKQYLQRPWGEQFVRDYYDKWENTYPIIDNIAEESVGFHYATAAEGLPKTTLALVQFVKFFFLQVSWSQFGGALGKEGVAPKWDLKRVREKENAFLLESVASDDPLKPAMEKAVNEGQINFVQLNLSNADLNAICDKRAALQSNQADLGLKPTISRCPESDETLGAIAQYLFRSRDYVFGDHLKTVYTMLKDSKKIDRPFQVFVYSHTHRADAGFRPLTKSEPEWDPIVVNTGAWQRVITTEQLDAYIKQHKLSEGEVLPKITPEKLPECYSAIIIKPYAGTPTPILQYWTKEKDWQLAAKCTVSLNHG